MLIHATVLLLLPVAFGQYNLLDIQKGPIVHLWEWKWDDIARECEEFLAPKGFAAVQTSPPHENLVVEERGWLERLQVVSYKLVSRSGNEEQLKNMLQRCNKVGVRVFAHAVINHMTEHTDECVGVGGSKCDSEMMDYPEVPYNASDFNPDCDATRLATAVEVRECKIFGFNDLNQKRENVRDRIVEYLNHLLSIGFAGFSIDAAMNMYPSDLAEIYRRVNNLNSDLGLPENTRPFIYQEIYDYGTKNDVISYTEYTPLGLITDVMYSYQLNMIMKWRKPLNLLRNFGDKLAPDHMSVVSVDFYDLERRTDEEETQNYKKPVSYKTAIAFMLAWGHGYPLILSSYKFTDPEDGPPSDDKGNILSPDPDNEKNVCKNDWVCQHRWKQIYSMVAFNRATHGTQVTSWWDNGHQQMAFTKGNKGFVAFNMADKPLKMTLKTYMPPGKYCDVISGSIVDGKCEGTTAVEVNKRGYVEINIKPYNELDYEHGAWLAIFDHESSRLAGTASENKEEDEEKEGEEKEGKEKEGEEKESKEKEHEEKGEEEKEEKSEGESSST